MKFYCQRKGGRAHVRFPNTKDKELKISDGSIGKKKPDASHSGLSSTDS